MPYLLILGGLAATAVYFLMPKSSGASAGGGGAGYGASSASAPPGVAHPAAYNAASTALGAMKGDAIREGAKVVQYFAGGYTELWDTGVMKTVLYTAGGNFSVVFEARV